MWLRLTTNKKKSVLVPVDKIMALEKRDIGTHISFTVMTTNAKGHAVPKSMLVLEDFEILSKRLGAK